MNTIGELIKEKRRDRYLTQRELADMTGLSVATINNIETNKTLPNSQTIFKLIQILDINVEQLIQEK